MKIRIINYGLDPNRLPKRAHYNDAGADVYSPRRVELAPGTTEKIGLNFGVVLPDGMVGFVFSRSSLSAKGIVCELPPIDAGYRGEIHAVVTNVGTAPYIIEAGDRIGQLVIFPVCTPDFVYRLEDERETGAFGSTGK